MPCLVVNKFVSENKQLQLLFLHNNSCEKLRQVKRFSSKSFIILNIESSLLVEQDCYSEALI